MVRHVGNSHWRGLSDPGWRMDGTSGWAVGAVSADQPELASTAISDAVATVVLFILNVSLVL